MKKEHRKILAELQSLCNQLGSSLDGTATNPMKYIDRQKAMMDVSHILFAVLADHPENEDREDDFRRAEKSIQWLRTLKGKIYPDRSGFIKPEEVKKINY